MKHSPPVERAVDDELGTRVQTANPVLLRLVEYARQIAPTPYSVLIEGETGTGKELFARGIHAASDRTGPFIPLNCGAVPENMFEAELFGARRGAYTGLQDERPGLFVVANRGTLFLDEVADMPASTQAKLLRVLEDGVIRPIGGTSATRVDVRVLAATHKSLRPQVESGAFRGDLFFRLSQVFLRLPALRERPEDIGLLARVALDEASRLQQVGPHALSPGALRALNEYDWPGNMRELKSVMAMALFRATDQVIRARDLPEPIGSGSESEPRGRRPFFDALEQFERDYFSGLAAESDGNISRAARLAGLSRGTIRSKLRRYHLTDEGTAPTGTTPRRSRARLATPASKRERPGG